MANDNISDVNKATSNTFGVVPSHHFIWMARQKTSVQTLWGESWGCDLFGDKWVRLETSLKKTAFHEAKKIISDAGLFEYKQDTEVIQGKRVSFWQVRNLNAKRSSKTTSQNTVVDDSANTNSQFANTNSQFANTNSQFANTNWDNTQTIATQAFQNLSGISQEYTNNNKEKELNLDPKEDKRELIKPDLDQARVRDSEKENHSHCDEPTLNATAQQVSQKEIENSLDAVWISPKGRHIRMTSQAKAEIKRLLTDLNKKAHADFYSDEEYQSAVNSLCREFFKTNYGVEIKPEIASKASMALKEAC